MAEEKKKPESEEEKKPEVPEVEKAEEKKEEVPKTEENAAEEKSEKAEEKAPDEKQAEETAPEAEKSDVPDDKDEEILRLKTQIEAMKLGISGDCMEDAVAIAESYVKSGKSSDINAALSAVVKKYPDMKSSDKEAKKGGFKVGADSGTKENNSDSSRLSQAFGIKKKGKV